MRKVLYKKWINREYTDGMLIKAGTNIWEPEFTHEGVFHQWAYGYEPTGENSGATTFALVENPDGTISEVFPHALKFIEGWK